MRANGLRYALSGHRWVGVDSVWEQEKLEARKILENAAESHTSGARFVRLRHLDATHRVSKAALRLFADQKLLSTCCLYIQKQPFSNNACVEKNDWFLYPVVEDLHS